MKNKILYVAAIIICLSILSGGTAAYYTAAGTAQNVITSGSVDIELVEQQLVNGQLQPYPSEPVKVLPNNTFSKIVSVRSVEQTAWIRAAYKLTVYDANGKEMKISDEELATVILIDPDTTCWTYKDGWWYYKDAVRGGDTTKPLFESVSFSGPDMGNKYQKCTLHIEVIAQAVQQANNGSTVFDAAGWTED